MISETALIAALSVGVRLDSRNLINVSRENLQNDLTDMSDSGDFNAKNASSARIKSDKTEIVRRPLLATLLFDHLNSASRKADAPPKTQKRSDRQVGFRELTAEEKARVQFLIMQAAKVQNDRETQVRVGGHYVGFPQYEFEKGPDNRQYAVRGHVDIDTQALAGRPEETIRKLRIVRRAALAPAEPSAEDRKAAIVASNGIQQAMLEIRERIRVELREFYNELAQKAENALREEARKKENFQPDQAPRLAADAYSSNAVPDADARAATVDASSHRAELAAQALAQAASLSDAGQNRASVHSQDLAGVRVSMGSLVDSAV